MGKEKFEKTLSETFKPIVNPLEKIVGDLENIKKIDTITKEEEEVKSEVKENIDDYGDDDDNYYDRDVTFKSFDNEQGDEKEDSSNLEQPNLNETETNLEPSSSSFSSSFSSWKDDTNNYLILLGERSKDLDNVYGVRKLTADRLMIGDSPISVRQNNIRVGNLNFPKSKGLLELLFKKVPEESIISPLKSTTRRSKNRDSSGQGMIPQHLIAREGYQLD